MQGFFPVEITNHLAFEMSSQNAEHLALAAVLHSYGFANAVER
jgi:hypothetical protein